MSVLGHGAEHTLAARQHEADGHDGEQEEGEAQERGEDPTPAPPLLVLEHLLGQQLGTGQVQGEVRLWSASRLQKDRKQ